MSGTRCRNNLPSNPGMSPGCATSPCAQCASWISVSQGPRLSQVSLLSKGSLLCAGGPVQTAWS